MKKSVAIIGGGPAGLMAAEVICARGLKVEVYDAMPSMGRKFLMAGKSGLNFTHVESFEQFVARYGNRKKEIEKWLSDFSPDDLRDWVNGLGVKTFVGTSGRVFPLGMKASPLLRAWLNRLTEAGVDFHVRHKWNGWDAQGQLKFATAAGEKLIQADAVILALGGGSWPRLGSDGAWVNWLKQAGVGLESLRPANCGFDVKWSEHFRARFEGKPLKSVVLSFGDFRQQGEFIITQDGVEGGLIYTASALLRDETAAQGKAIMSLDLAPDKTEAQVLEKLSRPRGSRTMASHLEKTLGIKDVKAGLLREFLAKEDFTKMERLARVIKYLQVPLVAARPLEEAISTAGGVMFESLDESLMLKNVPGVFCAGEMLDWEAPTGGYLLTACFASGRAAGQGAAKWLEI